MVTNSFDPLKEGATTFDPVSNGATPISQDNGGWEDALPTVLGIGGGIAGHIAGVPLGDIETASPLGSIALGAAGSGLGGAIGETVRQGVRAATGREFDPLQILKSGGEQAAYGAIPGGDEVKALPIVGKIGENILGRTALRFGAGAVGSGVAQEIQNPGQVNKGEELSTGALNALGPAFGKIFGGITSAVPNAIQKRLAQSHFGLKAAENPEIAELAHANPIQSFENIKKSSQDTSQQLREVLDQKTGNINDFINNLVESAKNVPPAARGGLNPDQVAPVYRQWLEGVRNKVAQEYEDRTGNIIRSTQVAGIPLSFFNDVKAAIGKHYETDPIAKEMWDASKKYITKQYGDMPADVQKLWTKQGDLLLASGNAKKLLNARGVPSLGGSEGALGEIAGPGEFAAGILAHSPLGVGVGMGTTLLRQMKNPKVASIIKNLLESPGNVSDKAHLPDILQQIGIRVPGLLSQPQ